jgi:hypothetical protein
MTVVAGSCDLGKKRVRPLARLHLQGFLIAQLCDRTYMRFDYLI